ncbi:MAG: hypothetical protein E7678_02320, partial [Ruminococcaceae bacterium]|nr:hypothetical protein [Oscillospiraceae bacterium]
VNSAEDKELLQKYGLANEAQESLSYAMIIESDKRWTFINGADYFVYNHSRMGYMSAEEFQYYYTLLASTVNQMYPYYSKFTEEQSERFEVYVSVLQSLQNETEVCLQLENAFVDAVAYVTTDVIPTVYFLSGHGEEGTTANPYDFKKAGNLPKNTDVAVINSPSEDYSKAEIDTLIEYVENGGKLYILTDIDNYSMPNFMSLLTRYGLCVETDVISADGKTAIPIEVNKDHDAFSKMSASKVTMKDVNKITYLEDSGYTYAPMLSYKVTENDGEAENTVEYPVAVSVSDGEEKKITLFTGATTFNSSESGLSEEELAEVSPCVTNVMSWMFDAFESNVENAPPKSYQKTIYMADSGQISKIVIAFVAFAFIIALSCSAYILSRNLRSKRAILANDAE